MPDVPQYNKPAGKIRLEERRKVVPGLKASPLSAFKCSKCDYTASNRVDFKEHWSLNH